MTLTYFKVKFVGTRGTIHEFACKLFPMQCVTSYIIQLITFHEVNMVKWRTRDLVLEVVWPDRGRRPRSGQTTESTRSRDLHFTMLAKWKVINCFIIPKKKLTSIYIVDQVNIQYWPGQYSILTRSIFNIDQVNIHLTGSIFTIDQVNIEYWPGHYMHTWHFVGH